jgi:hypothetical protein
VVICTTAGVTWSIRPAKLSGVAAAHEGAAIASGNRPIAQASNHARAPLITDRDDRMIIRWPLDSHPLSTETSFAASRNISNMGWPALRCPVRGINVCSSREQASPSTSKLDNACSRWILF